MQSWPPTPVTNYGLKLIQEGIEPNVTYTDSDKSIAFYIGGGLAPWPGVTEGIVLTEYPSGLTPSFNHLDHRGARQDGATWADTVYEPAEITLKVLAVGNTPEKTRQIIREWFDSWDPKKRGTLSWTTPTMGEWWCHPRLFRTPPEKLNSLRGTQQPLTWTIRNDDAFWRSHDSVSQFSFGFKASSDGFNRDDVGSLGSNWQQTYTGPGAGACESEPELNIFSPGRAVWKPSGNQERTVANRYLGSNSVRTITVFGTPTSIALTYDDETTSPISWPTSASTIQSALEALPNLAPGDVAVSGSNPFVVEFTGTLAKQAVGEMSATSTGGIAFVNVATTSTGGPATTDTDNQVVTLRIGEFFQFPFPDAAFIDLWARRDGNDANPTGIRLRIGPQWIRLSRFNAGVETAMRERILALAPLWREEWKLLCGVGDNARRFQVLRGDFTVLDFKETGTGSALGASYRGSGFGMEAGEGLFGSQMVPPSVLEWAVGDNAESTQSGHLTVTNIGDQPGSPDLIVYGPGTFKFGNGPDVPPTIEFGPLADGQIALIKTAPGQKAVYDITTDQSEQDLPFFQDFLKRLIGLAFNNNTPPLLKWFESLFGIAPEQGNLYSLLKGRWTRTIPPKPVASPPVTSTIAVEVAGGNANTKVIAALTPRRRWPE